MATWTDIPNASLEPGAPARSVDAIALRDNDVYLRSIMAGTETEKVVDAALSTTVTTTGRDWVLNRTAQADAGAVGTYAFMADRTNSTTNLAAGSTVAGSSLTYSSDYYDSAVPDYRFYADSIPPSGTWRLMGYGVRSSGSTTIRYASLWLRIS